MNGSSPVPLGEADPVAPPTETIRFPVSGMTCTACVSRVTRALRLVDGVLSVRVDLRHEVVHVRRVPSLVPDEAIEAAVASAGYRAHLDRVEPGRDTAERSMLERLVARLR